MNSCFVIQPFDGGAFDKRFDDVLEPAIHAASLRAYRVDRDPAVTIAIDAIETGIREAYACLVDISTNNPNVWFELGYALACRKPVVLVCTAERASPFPFDVAHRHIIRYRTDSPSDFTSLASEITARLKAVLHKESKVQALAVSTLEETEGLDPHEIATLVVIAESDLDPDSYPSAYTLKQDLSRAGYTELATVLAVKALLAKGLIGKSVVQSEHNDYEGFHLLQKGNSWLESNRSRLVLRKRPAIPTLTDSLMDDDLPF